MQVSVESTSELSRKMTVQVPESEIQARVSKRLQSLSSRVRVDGFRPGKVPQSVIKKRFGQQVREEILSDLIQSSFQDAVRGEQLRPAGAPEIVAHKADEGEGLEYEARFEVLPDFVPMPLETLEVKRYVSAVTESDVDTMIEKLREQRTTWYRIDEPAQTGHRVIISFEGKDGDETFTNGRVENFAVVLGAGTMIPAFEEKLAGVSAGDHLEFEVQFPADYPGPRMAGKTGYFSVDVNQVEAARIPPLDAEFAKSFGIEDGDLTAFRAEIRGNMEREMRRSLQTRTKNSVMDQLYAKNAITLPLVLVNDELNSLIKPYRESAKQRSQTLDESALRTQLEPIARRRVALALILGKLIDAYRLVVNAERVRATVTDLAQSYEDPDAVIRWYYAEKGRLREIEGVVLEDQVVDLVLEKAQTTEEWVPFQEFLQQSPGNAPGVTPNLTSSEG